MMFVNHLMGNRCETVSRPLLSGIMHGRGGVSLPSWYLQSLGTAATSTRTDILLWKLAKMTESCFARQCHRRSRELQVDCGLGWSERSNVFPSWGILLFQPSSFFSTIHLKCDLLDHLHGVVLNICLGCGQEQLDLFWRPDKIV